MPALLPAALIFAAAAAWVVWIDLDVQRIPDRPLAVATPLVAAAGWTGAAVVGQWWRVWTSLAAGAVLMTLYFLLAMVGSMASATSSWPAWSGYSWDCTTGRPSPSGPSSHSLSAASPPWCYWLAATGCTTRW